LLDLTVAYLHLHRCYSVRTSSIIRETYPKTLQQKLRIPQKGPECSVPPCAWFWLENFLFLASTTAAAAAAAGDKE
jgi:hypothetical protein